MFLQNFSGFKQILVKRKYLWLLSKKNFAWLKKFNSITKQNIFFIKE